MSRTLRILILVVFSPTSLLAQEPESPEPATVEATLKSDLRNLVTSQEVFFADHGTYAMSLSELAGTGIYSPSEGVTVVVILSSIRGWNAVAVDDRVPGLVCAMWVGAPGAVTPPLDDNSAEGEATCIRPGMSPVSFSL